MAQNDAFRLCALAALAVLASACAMIQGPPAPIPADQVLAPPAPPAPPAHDAVPMSEEFHAAGIGADQLRGTLNAQ
jgi:hypothetical protein